MKASELKSELQALIKKYGDKEIEVNGEYNSHYPIDTCSRLEITRIDLFGDSANYQLLIDNSINIMED